MIPFGEVVITAITNAVVQQALNKRQAAVDRDRERASTGFERLSAEHREFRRNSPVTWDRYGKLVNPHQDRLAYFGERRSDSTDQLSQVQIDLQSTKSLRDRADDFTVTLTLIR